MHRRLDAATALGDEPASATDEPAADAATATLVARAADEYLERLAAGESPDVDEFVRRYPQVAGVLPQVLPALGLLKALAPLEPAPAVLGEFRIVREIGRGGMGVVYEAEQVSLGRRVALKVLPAAGAADARPLARFQVEARVMAALHHPHIVPIFAVGCDRGVHYYAMQLVAGCSLADRLRGTARDRPSPREAARLAMQAAEALEHAHGLGVLHRDIKPGNLLVEPGGHLWVTDFGLARWEDGGDLTGSGDVPGTLRYMSPEQAAGGRVLDPRTDVYSLGATLYELLAGAARLRRQRPRRAAPPDRPRRAGPAAPARPDDPARPGDDRRQGDGQGARAPLRHGPRAGRRPRPVPRRPADPGPAAGARRAAGALVAPARAGDGRRRGAAGRWRSWPRPSAWPGSGRSSGGRTPRSSTAQEARRNEHQALLFTFTASDQVAGRALARIAIGRRRAGPRRAGPRPRVLPHRPWATTRRSPAGTAATPRCRRSSPPPTIASASSG